MLEIKKFLSPLHVEIVTSIKRDEGYHLNKNLNQSTIENVVDFLKRRPATVNDLVEALGLKIVEVNKFLRELEKDKTLSFKDEKRGRFYYINKEIVINRFKF